MWMGVYRDSWRSSGIHDASMRYGAINIMVIAWDCLSTAYHPGSRKWLPIQAWCRRHPLQSRFGHRWARTHHGLKVTHQVKAAGMGTRLFHPREGEHRWDACSLALCLVEVPLTPSSLFASCRRSSSQLKHYSTLPSSTLRKPSIMCQGRSYGGP